MSTTQIRLGGVPEHFNLPVHLAAERGEFARRGVELAWTTFRGGTGEMTRALREGTVDSCILLTEGIIADLIAGNPCKIVSGYVDTPLTWGVHTGAGSSLRHHGEAYGGRYAISRFGSGSHLMAIVDADVQGRTLAREQFTVVGNLEGALTSLTRGDTDVFYWEKYTTKPYVDDGRLRRIGEFVTPWPCFVVAATDEVIARAPEALTRTLRVLHDSCDAFMQTDDASIGLVADRYGLSVADATRWYHATQWAIHGWVSDKMLRSVVHSLRAAGIVADRQAVPELVWRRDRS